MLNNPCLNILINSDQKRPIKNDDGQLFQQKNIIY